jgi:hypothetical protein
VVDPVGEKEARHSGHEANVALKTFDSRPCD